MSQDDNVKKVIFNLNSLDFILIDDKLKKAYDTYNNIIFEFDVTNITISNINVIPQILKLITKYKHKEYKLKCIDIKCPKIQTIKRKLIKDCVRIASKQITKPVYIIT